MSGNQFRRALRELVSTLDALSVPWALIGGLAVAVRSEPVGLRSEVQIALPSRASALDVDERLERRGYEVSSRSGHAAAGGPVKTRLRAPVEGYPVSVSLVFADSGIEPEVITASTRLEVIPGLSAPVARTGHLIALAVSAGGLVALADLKLLFTYADDEEVGVARQAVQRIMERGPDDGEDLLTDFEHRLAAL